MPAPHVVEHPVEQDPQAAVVRGGDERVEVGVVTEAGIDPEVVGRVVAVRLGREDGPEQDAGDAELNGVVQPGGELPQPAVLAAGGMRADEAERVDLPPHGVFDPVRLTHGIAPRGREYAETPARTGPASDLRSLRRSRWRGACAAWSGPW